MLDKNLFLEVYEKVGFEVNYLGIDDYLDLFESIKLSREKSLDLSESIDKVFDGIKFFMNEEGISLNKCSFDIFNPTSRVFSKYLVLYPSEYSYYLDVMDTKSVFKSFLLDEVDMFVYSYDGDYSFDKEGLLNDVFVKNNSFKYNGCSNYLGKSDILGKTFKLNYKES